MARTNPAKSFSKDLRYFSYSIPLACIMTLIIGLIYGICFITPNSNVYAEGDEGIMPLATANPSASLTITTPTLSTNVTPGEIGYLSTNVSYNAVDTTAYTLQVTYANGYSSLKQDGSTNTIAGVGTSGTTGANMANSNTNAWGFGWGSTSTANANLAYYTLPTYGTKGSSISTGGLENGTSITSTTKKLVFAAKFASNNTNTGHYKTQVLLSLSATPKATYNYSLSYNANGGTGAPSTQTANSQDTTSYTFAISNTKPIRTGYDFLGWADSSTASSAQYSSGGTITLQSSIPNKTIYAVWEKQLATSFPSTLTTMQSMTSAICAEVAIGTSKTLTDTRDNNTYTIARLSDGKCWMTQNLRLPANTYISSASSDVSSSYTLPSSKVEGSSETGSDKMLNATNSTFGAYYTWQIVTANTYSSAQEDGSNAPSSICPKGWRLPTGGSSGEFKALSDRYSSKVGTWGTDSLTAGYWLGASTTADGGSFFPAPGYLDAGTKIMGKGTKGVYWSSTGSGLNGGRISAFNLNLSANSINLSSRRDYYYANSVRCIAK